MVVAVLENVIIAPLSEPVLDGSGWHVARLPGIGSGQYG